MKSIRATMVTVSLLTLLSSLVSAQAATEAVSPEPRIERMEKMHAKMAAHRAQHLAALKGKLQLQASQEAAWTAFAAPMQRHEHAARPARAAMEKLSTPERLDRMQALRTARDTQMQKHIAATHAFYAVLSPEQKSIFDKETVHRFDGMPERGRGMKKWHAHHGGL